MVVLLFLYLPFYSIAQSPCILENNTIRRQSQLDSIPLLFPECDYIDEIHVIGKDIIDLTSLKVLKKINSIVIRGTVIKSLKGLDSVNYCNNMDIIGNDSLENILALKEVNSTFKISIINNNKLISYEGLETDSIRIYLEKNNKCRSLKGIKAKNVENITIWNPNLETFSGHEIEYVQNMNVAYAKHLKGIGSLDVLKLNIETSEFLVDISSIDSLQNLVQLNLFGNKNLSMCSIDIICQNLDNPAFSLQARTNAPGCNSKVEIRQKCISSTNQNETENELSLFPNPVHESLRISGLDGDVSFSLYNHVGALIQKGSTSGDVDVSGLPSGMYILTLTGATSGDKTVFRFVKM